MSKLMMLKKKFNHYLKYIGHAFTLRFLGPKYIVFGCRWCTSQVFLLTQAKVNC